MTTAACWKARHRSRRRSRRGRPCTRRAKCATPMAFLARCCARPRRCAGGTARLQTRSSSCAMRPRAGAWSTSSSGASGGSSRVIIAPMDLPRAAPPQEIAELDRTDILSGFREQFELPAGIIYLDGNSLGALPRRTRERIESVVAHEWGRDLITSWNGADWISLPQRTGDRIGALIGAAKGQVIAADSTSVKLFK